MICTDQHLTIVQLAVMLDMSIRSILYDHLNVSRVYGCWVPRLSTPSQKQNRVEACPIYKSFGKLKFLPTF